ncbi:MAG: FtsQ-type POTRA domain-containing protein [Dehalococcoidia bacterium]|nr:FtsQ-type POTRA domain-containing protein [Dehalococcoidia bacterium]
MVERAATIIGRSRTIMVAGAGVLLALSGIGLYNHPMFRVTTVRVSGAQAVSPTAIVEATGLVGRHILGVSDQAVASALSQYPRIKHVTVTRHLPNEVELVVHERAPWAVWQTTNGSFLVDSDGVVLEAVKTPPPLPVIAYNGPSPTRPGAQTPVEPVRLAAELTRRWPDSVKAKPKRFEYSDAGGLLVVTDQGWQARFGDAEDLDYKLATLSAIVDTARARKQAFVAIDLRFGYRPFIR